MPENGFEREVLDRLKTIEVKMDSYAEITRQVKENQMNIIKGQEKDEQQQKDIDELKDRNKWLSRTIGASLIGIAVAVVVFAIQLGAIK